MTKQHDAHQLSGAYAVHAVTPEEAAYVEAAMRDSEDLRSEVVGLVDTAVALGLAVPKATPPAALRARLLDAIEDLPQLPAEESVEAEEIAIPAMPVGAHVASRRRRRVMTRPSVLVAMVAVAALLFSGGFLLQRVVLEPQTKYSQVVAASDAQSKTGNVRGGGTVTVSWSPSQHRTAVSLTGVRVPSGKVLQLWHVRGSAITSAGLYGSYEVIEGTPTTGDQLAVSVEPPAGSTQPTTAPIAIVALA